MKTRTILFYWAILYLFTTTLPAAAQKILASSTAKHQFSDPAAQDIFKLTLTGTTLHKSNAAFEIINSRGVRIYYERFAGISLLNELDVDAFNLNLRQQEEYIRKRVKEFFHAKNFLKPAIGLKEISYSDNSDLKIWNTIRANRNAVGFSFLLGYEYSRKIAWSKTLNKTVVYWSCC